MRQKYFYPAIQSQLQNSRERRRPACKFLKNAGVCPRSRQSRKVLQLALQFILVLGICAARANAQDSTALLSEIIQSVQKDVELLKDSIVDITSREEVTIEENFNKKGNPGKTTSIISEYRIFPAEKTVTFSDCRAISEILANQAGGKGVLREERKMISRKGNYNDPIIQQYWIRPDNFVDLMAAFDKQNENCFDYELLGAAEFNKRKVYRILITGKGIYNLNPAVTTWQSGYKGEALIDAETMAIVRLSKDRINAGGYIVFVSYDYEKVMLRDQFLTMVMAKTVESFRANDGQLSMLYKYRYGDYKAFTTQTTIRFGTIEESPDELENE